MKTAIVYYSMGGNTACVAQRLAEALAADVIGLTPAKAYPDKGFKKFFWGGKSAVMAETPALTPYDFRADAYDRIVIGFPVWAGRVAPPVRTFVEENRDALRGKEIAAFACQAGSGAEKALNGLKELLGISGFRAEMTLIDPKNKPGADVEEKISAFCGALKA